MARPRLSITKVAFGASLALSIFLVGAAIFGDNGAARHQMLQTKLENVRVLNESLKQENDKLREQRDRLKDDHGPNEFVEAAIRDELGFVRKDELVFIFPSAPEPKPDGGEAGEPKK
ncbi:septum formation initiator family protein [Myxococcota bacterium]|nr:septum formation initiator family protein [Myxococcota bacterium]